METLYCQHCNNYVTPQSGKCPNCGYQFTLKDIIPDNEVQEYKDDQMSKMTTIIIIEIIGIIFLFIIGNSIPFIGGIFTMFGFGMIIPLLIGIGTYISYSNKSLDEWRVVLGKSWKYQSKLNKAGTILKLLNALSGI